MKENKDLVPGDRVGVTKCSYVERAQVINANGKPPYTITEKVDQCTFSVMTPKRGEVMMPSCVIKFWEEGE